MILSKVWLKYFDKLGAFNRNSINNMLITSIQIMLKYTTKTAKDLNLSICTTVINDRFKYTFK